MRFTALVIYISCYYFTRLVYSSENGENLVDDDFYTVGPTVQDTVSLTNSFNATKTLSPTKTPTNAPIKLSTSAPIKAPTKKPTGPCDPNAAKSPLCGVSDMVATVPGNCKSAFVDFGDVEPCCEAQTVLSDPCHIEDGFGKCRTATIANAVCSAQNMECQAITLKISFEIYRKTGTCCETCSCYGDPHCESFNGVIDTWLLCDARVRDSPTSTTCHISQTSCVKQLDHKGIPCVWRKPPYGGTWFFGLWGSQCMFSSGRQDLPEMTMYKADDFSLKLRLGERGIIVQARLEDNGKLYLLNAEDCWNDYLNNERNPWRASDTATGPLTDPNWLPNKWKGQLLPGDDRLWSIFGLKSGIKANIRCTRNIVKVEGKPRLGLPRLNIEEIVEPVDPKNRTSASGFCVEDKINKMKSSYETTDKLKELGVCLEDQGGLLIGRLLCSKGVTEAGLDLCKQNWCKKVRPDWEKCFLDIGRFGWARTWCSAYILQNPDPIYCVDGDCMKCVSDILDFGWEEAIPIWENYSKGGGVTGPCLTVDKLPNKLEACQKGIEIQYEETPGNWKTFKAIPDTVHLCNPTIEFVNIDPTSAPLFAYPIRIKQCSLDANCLQDSCTPELGFKASFKFESDKTDSTSLVGLVQSNNLVCNPAKWPKDKYGCIKIVPPKACPCGITGKQI